MSFDYYPPSISSYKTRIELTNPGIEVRASGLRTLKIYSTNEKYPRLVGKGRLTANGKLEVDNSKYELLPHEKEAIEAELANHVFLRTVHARNIDTFIPIPPNKGGGKVYIIRNRQVPYGEGDIQFVTQRVDYIDKSGKFRKNYIPSTMIETGQWLNMEPDGRQCFWKPEVRRLPKGSPIMIHEGVKPAEYVDHLVNIDKGIINFTTQEIHPYYSDLRQFEHWGTVGGVNAYNELNFAELHAENPSRVIYAADNDNAGKTAAVTFSKLYNKKMQWFYPNEVRFPRSWDLADPIPKEFYRSE
jgi:hypothetical protein